MSRDLVVVLRCDICGADAETIDITYGGDAYQVELCPEHGEPVARLVAIGRRAKKYRRKRRGGTDKPVPITVVASNGQVKRDRERDAKQLRDMVRIHARENGIEQAPTGYLRAAAIDAWVAEHPEDRQLLMADPNARPKAAGHG